MIVSRKTILGLVSMVVFMTPVTSAVASDRVKELVKEQVATGEVARSSQEKIEQISEETQRLLDEYRMVLRETDNLEIYNAQMERLVASQSAEQESIRKQITSIEQTHKEVVPLMLTMLDTLGKFVALDLPFLTDERQARLEDLRAMMDRADVSTSEKYRRVLEAYQVEGEYGRTIESYRGVVQTNGKSLTVDLLRIGRLALIYQTLDGEETGIWNSQSGTWEILPSSYRRSVTDGLRIANRQVAPDLITLPIPSPEVL